MLGTVDFSGVDKKLNGTYEGQTEGWEAKPSKAGDSTNVIITFSFADEEGNIRKHPEYYSMKPNALWRAKRDLVAMGADPADFESTKVDLESILNEAVLASRHSGQPHVRVRQQDRLQRPREGRGRLA
jgi:hypothetical protein